MYFSSDLPSSAAALWACFSSRNLISVCAAILVIFGVSVDASADLVTTDLLIQLDASTNVTTSGMAVTSWGDQAPNGGSQNFLADLGSATLSTSVTPNGVTTNVIDFDGNDTLRLGADSALDNANTQSWYMVTRFDTATSNASQGAFGMNTSASATKLTTGIASNKAAHLLRNAGGTQKTLNGSSAFAPMDGDWVLISGRWNMTAGVVNGVGAATAAIGVRGPDGLLKSSGSLAMDGLFGIHNQTILGNRGDKHSGRFLDGAFAELLVYDDILTSAEQSSVENYLLDKYFVTAAVPEPSILPLWALGTCWIGVARRRRRAS